MTYFCDSLQPLSANPMYKLHFTSYTAYSVYNYTLHITICNTNSLEAIDSRYLGL